MIIWEAWVSHLPLQPRNASEPDFLSSELISETAFLREGWVELITTVINSQLIDWLIEVENTIVEKNVFEQCVFPELLPLFKGAGRAHTGPYWPIWE